MKKSRIIGIGILSMFILFLACRSSVKDYDENGCLKTIKTSLGDNIWEMEYYYPNGLLKAKGKYKDSTKIGVWKEWYSDGQEKWHGAYQDGFRVVEVHQQEPVIILSGKNNALSAGQATGVKILVEGLHPEDAAYSINNGVMEKRVEDTASDIHIIPERKGELKIKVYALNFRVDYFIGEITLSVE
ncbi:toxin-antitoxin system YwqK family antitoxin [Alkaliflexus imshenetskii]|uniref:toxin-antitoxin system YwqK family antitoxin n=1 Tax=Alkaliflexus imshenetskii TaxID=286730 RepID=UPI00047D39C8|nr:hypothetical protein [Alkaliflexus imshenetskii]